MMQNTTRYLLLIAKTDRDPLMCYLDLHKTENMVVVLKRLTAFWYWLKNEGLQPDSCLGIHHFFYFVTLNDEQADAGWKDIRLYDEWCSR